VENEQQKTISSILQTGMFDMPKPQGWTIERMINLMAGGIVLTTLSLGRERSKHWRLLTTFVGITSLWTLVSAGVHRASFYTTWVCQQRPSVPSNVSRQTEDGLQTRWFCR